MKLLSSYMKEMKIASRGFYFYIEIFVALLLLGVIVFLVNPNPEGKVEEYLYYDMPEEVFEESLLKELEEGKLEWGKDREFELEESSFEIENQETSQTISYDFDGPKTVQANTLLAFERDSDKLAKTAYIFEEKEDALRLANQNEKLAASISIDEKGELSYQYYLQGYETDRYFNMLYMIHTYPEEELMAKMDQTKVRELNKKRIPLNNQEAIVPIFVVMAGSLMGIFIIMAYVFLDKDEGVIRAFAVSPSSLRKYLFTKIFVVLTSVVISASIVVIPIMKTQPNYLFFYLFLLVTSFAFSALGLFLSSFFDNISKAFGVLYTVMLALMLPVFSYYLPSFDPVWLRYFPTSLALEEMKVILMGEGEFLTVILYSLGFLLAGGLLFEWSNQRFKKTLTH